MPAIWQITPYSAHQASMLGAGPVVVHALRELLWALGMPSTTGLDELPMIEFDGFDLLVTWR